MALVVDIAELKNQAGKIKDLANYYSGKQSTFSYGSFNTYSCTKLANYINSVGQLFNSISNNLTNTKNYIENYANDISLLDKKNAKAEDIIIYKVSDAKMFQVNKYKDSGSQNITSLSAVLGELKAKGLTSTDAYRILNNEITEQDLLAEIFSDPERLNLYLNANPEVFEKIKEQYKSAGLIDEDIERLIKGELTYEELMEEIRFDDDRKRSLFIANILHSEQLAQYDFAGLGINSLEDLDNKIQSLQTEYDDILKYQSLYKLCQADMNDYEDEYSIYNHLFLVGYKQSDGTIANAWGMSNGKYIDNYKDGVPLYKYVDYYDEDDYTVYDLNQGQIIYGDDEVFKKFKEAYESNNYDKKKEVLEMLSEYNERVKELETEIDGYTRVKLSIESMIEEQLILDRPDFDEKKIFIENFSAKEWPNIAKERGYACGDVPGGDVYFIPEGDYDIEAQYLFWQFSLDNDEVDKAWVYYEDIGNVKFKSEDKLIENLIDYAPYITDEEKHIFIYKYNTEGAESAINYMKSLIPRFDSKYCMAKQQEYADWATDNWFNGVIASLGSVVITPFEGIAAGFKSVDALISGDELLRKDIFSVGNALRSGVSSYISENAGEGWAFLYNTGMSVADSGLLILATAATGGTGTLALSAGLMGSRAYVSSLDDALARGLSTDQAVLYAGGQAALESLMENYSVGHLMNLEGHLGTFTQALVEKASETGYKWLPKLVTVAAGTVSQALAEGEEEACTEILGRFWDNLVAGDLSNFNLSVEKYMSEGHSEAEAIELANKDFNGQVFDSFLGGFTSGIFFGLCGSVKTVKTASAYANNLTQNASYEGTFAEAYANGFSISSLLTEEGLNSKAILKAGISLDTVLKEDGTTFRNILENKVSESNSKIERTLYGKILAVLDSLTNIEVTSDIAAEAGGLESIEQFSLNNDTTKAELDALVREHESTRTVQDKIQEVLFLAEQGKEQIAIDVQNIEEARAVWQGVGPEVSSRIEFNVLDGSHVDNKFFVDELYRSLQGSNQNTESGKETNTVEDISLVNDSTKSQLDALVREHESTRTVQDKIQEVLFLAEQGKEHIAIDVQNIEEARAVWQGVGPEVSSRIEFNVLDGSHVDNKFFVDELYRSLQGSNQNTGNSPQIEIVKNTDGKPTVDMTEFELLDEIANSNPIDIVSSEKEKAISDAKEFVHGKLKEILLDFWGKSMKREIKAVPKSIEFVTSDEIAKYNSAPKVAGLQHDKRILINTDFALDAKDILLTIATHESNHRIFKFDIDVNNDKWRQFLNDVNYLGIDMNNISRAEMTGLNITVYNLEGNPVKLFRGINEVLTEMFTAQQLGDRYSNGDNYFNEAIDIMQRMVNCGIISENTLKEAYKNHNIYLIMYEVIESFNNAGVNLDFWQLIYDFDCAVYSDVNVKNDGLARLQDTMDSYLKLATGTEATGEIPIVEDTEITAKLPKIDETTPSIIFPELNQTLNIYVDSFKNLPVQEKAEVIKKCNLFDIVSIDDLLNQEPSLKDVIEERLIAEQNSIIAKVSTNLTGEGMFCLEYIANSPELLSKLNTSNLSLLAALTSKSEITQPIINELTARVSNGELIFATPSLNRCYHGTAFNDMDRVANMFSEQNPDGWNQLITNFSQRYKSTINPNLKKIINPLPLSIYQRLQIALLSKASKINDSSIRVLEKMLENPTMIQSLDFNMLASDIINDFGEEFVINIARFKNLTMRLTFLKENHPHIYEAYKTLMNRNMNSNSLLAKETIISSTLDFMFEYADYLGDIDDINLESLQEYILTTRILGNDTNIVFSDNFIGEYRALLDERVNGIDKTSSTAINDYKDAYFKKYYSMSLESAKVLCTKYGTNLEEIRKDGNHAGQVLNDIMFVLEAKTFDSIANDYGDTLGEIYEKQSEYYTATEMLNIDDHLHDWYIQSYQKAFAETIKEIENSNHRTIDVNGKDVTIVNLKKPFSFLVYSSDTGISLVKKKITSFIEAFKNVRNGETHALSSSFITQENIGTVSVGEAGVLYGFVDASKIRAMGAQDINSNIADYGFSTKVKQQFITASQMSKYTTRCYNEFIQDRNNLTPDYIILLSDASEAVRHNSLSAAAEWNIPVIEIDVKDLATNQINEVNNLLSSFKETGNIEYLKQAIEKYEAGASGFNINIPSEEMDKRTNIHESVRSIFESCPIIQMCQEYLQEIIDLKDIDKLCDYRDILEEVQSRFKNTNNSDRVITSVAKTKSMLDISTMLTQINNYFLTNCNAKRST